MKTKPFLVALFSVAIFLTATIVAEANRPGRGGVVVPPPPIGAEDTSPR